MESGSFKSYMQQITRYPLFSFEEEIEHSKRIQQGDESARMELVQANLRLVVSIAKKYESPYAPLMDLIQEGNIGLMTAAGKYHYSYNTRFSTYAYAWIVQAITRYIKSKCGLISLPNRKEDELRKVSAARVYLFQQLGREPSAAEIARRLSLSVDEVETINHYAYTVISMSEEKDESSGQTVGSLLADERPDPEEQLIAEEKIQELHSMVRSLPEMERRVVFSRYNFRHDDKVKTLRQLGNELGVSAETVRQMEIRALKHLKKTAEERELSFGA